MYQCIVCDPGPKKSEGSAIGLLYTAVSRGTTLGDENGLGSAVYFTGSDFTADRIYHMYKRKNSMDDYELFKKRTKWVDHIRRNTISRQMDPGRLECITDWCRDTHHTYDELYHAITSYTSANINPSRPTGKRRRS